MNGDNDEDTGSEEDSSSPSPSSSKRRSPSKSIQKATRPKPPNPFILFSLENRQKIAEENKDISNSEISRLLGIAWRKLHPDEKRKYKARAKEVKDAFHDPNYVFNTGKNGADVNLYSLFCSLRDANIALSTLAHPPVDNNLNEDS